jgi:hypothetical protein
MGKLRYIWEDADGNEQISREPPTEIKGIFGGYYIPDYRKVVVIEVEEE